MNLHFMTTFEGVKHFLKNKEVNIIKYIDVKKLNSIPIYTQEIDRDFFLQGTYISVKKLLHALQRI